MKHYPVFRIMIHNDTDRYFGIGTFDLLKQIDQKKSVKEAAEAMGLSYSKSWKMLNHMEEALQLQVLDRQQGGPYGGSTELTEDGKKFLESYEKMLGHIEYFLELEFQKQFGWLEKLEANDN
ncbi:MAG: LysR family transcriptional regulator [Eubacteriaceae bacterium]|nr:LysR family transcriptional regulator [Eubacteriaceae bacterium]